MLSLEWDEMLGIFMTNFLEVWSRFPRVSRSFRIAFDVSFFFQTELDFCELCESKLFFCYNFRLEGNNEVSVSTSSSLHFCVFNAINKCPSMMGF